MNDAARGDEGDRGASDRGSELVGLVRETGARIRSVAEAYGKDLAAARRDLEVEQSRVRALQAQLQRSYAAVHEAKLEAADLTRENDALAERLAAAEQRERAAVAWIKEACDYLEIVHGGVPDALKR